MRIVRTKPPEDYFPPTELEIQVAARRCGLQQFSPHLVADLCNIEAGGEFVPLYDQEEAINYEAEMKLVRKGNYYQTLDGNRYEVKSAAIDYNKNHVYGANMRVNDFVQGIAHAPAPGHSPLYRAINIIKALEMEGGNNTQGNGNGEQIPIFQPGQAEKAAERMKDLFDTIADLSPAERKLIMESGAEDQQESELKAMEIYKDMKNSDKKIWLEMSRKLDSLSSMKAKHSMKVEANIEGEDVQVRPIKDLGEIARMQKIEWTYPKIMRHLRIFTKAAMVRERVDRIYQKQLLYMLVDVSGSMSDGQKIPIAGGVVMNRLRAVIENEAEIFLRTFDGGVYPEHSAKNEDEAVALMDRFKKTNFSGGSTDITKAVLVALESIEKKMKKDPNLVRPEIVVVTDGGSSFSVDNNRLGETRLHVIMLQGGNDNLARVCRQSGGIFMELGGNIA